MEQADCVPHLKPHPNQRGWWLPLGEPFLLSGRTFPPRQWIHGPADPPFCLVLTTIQVKENSCKFLACGWHYPLPTRSCIDVSLHCFPSGHFDGNLEEKGAF